MTAMPDEPKMPQVWNLTYQEAKAVLDAADIPYRVFFSQTQTVPEGELLSVSPPPGTRLSANVQVVLTVSSGPPVVRAWG
jgi:beta-lactam-binding protein with PASTA domain